MRKAMSIEKGFTPDGDQLEFMVKTLAPEHYEQAVEMDKAKTPPPPPAQRFMGLIRALDLEIDWWAMMLVTHLATDELLGREPSSLKGIAHRMGLTEDQLGDLANRATADSVALLAMCLPSTTLKRLQIPVTSDIHSRATRMRKDLVSLASRN